MRTEWVFLFVSGLIGVLVLTPLVIRMCFRFRIFDYPNSRKVHDHPVPRIGGVALYAAFSLISVFLVIINDRIRASFYLNERFWISFGIGATIVFALGLYDDIKHASIWTKFAIQAIAALIPISQGGVLIQSIGIPLNGLLYIGWLAYPLTIIWIVGVTNAFNLIDGLDGLAGGIGFIATTSLFGLTVLSNGKSSVMLVTATLSGALLGFLFFNKHPAKIFLGDCGSMLIGYVLAILAVVGGYKKTTSLAITVPILIVGVPVFDTLLAMFRRLQKRVIREKKLNGSMFLSMFQADQGHIHHVLLGRGYTHSLSVIILLGLSLLMAAFALLAYIIEDTKMSIFLVVLGISSFFLVRGLRHKSGVNKAPRDSK